MVLLNAFRREAKEDFFVKGELLLVATEDRTYYTWAGPGLEDQITPDDVNDINASALEPNLRDGDFPGAVVSVAEIQASGSCHS